MRPADTSLIRTLPFASDAELRRRHLVTDKPLLGNIRFGLLLEVLDKLAEDCALAYARTANPGARVVTAAIDNIYIRSPGDATRDLTFRAMLNFVGTASMEVGIRVEHSPRPGDHVASCYVTMVARTGGGEIAKSLPLPSLEYAAPLEIRRRDKALQHRAEHRAALTALASPPAADEYAALAALHSAQEQPGFRGLLAERAVTHSWERMYPEYENVPEKIFGGYLIRRAYENAAIAVELAAPDRPVIVAVNRINFLQPVRLDDKLHFVSRVVHAGDHSLQVETEILRVGADRQARSLSNSCAFTFANVDDGLRLKPVEPLHPTTYAEDARWLAAHRRRLAHRHWRETVGRAKRGRGLR